MSTTCSEPDLTSLLDIAAECSSGIWYYNAPDNPPSFTSYRELREEASRRAPILRRVCGSRQCTIVLIHFRTHQENVLWLWATLLAGLIPTMSTPLVNNREGRLAHLKHLHELLLDPTVITTLECSNTDFEGDTKLTILTTEAIESDLKHGETNQPIVKSVTKSQNAIQSDQSTAIDNVALLMLTSGSTGSAKAVCLRQEQIMASCRGKLAHLEMQAARGCLNWIGLDHVGSLIELHLTGMMACSDQFHVPSKEIVGNPLLFVKLLSKHSIARTFGPNFFLHELHRALAEATPAQLTGVDLRHLRYLISGGEPNDTKSCVALSEQLQKLGSHGGVITPGFGMTETCAGSIYSRNCPAIDCLAGTEFASLGTCVPGIEMRVSRSDLSIHEGDLEVKGPIVFQRYFNNSQATQEAFTSDGWFRTGDRATISDDGVLRLVGRAKELIIVNGMKYLPHELESELEHDGIPGISPSCIVCFAYRPAGAETEQVYVVYQHSYNADDALARMNTLQAIIRSVLMFTGARPRVLPLAPSTLERTTLGKISRSKVKTSLMRGEYQDQIEHDEQILRTARQTSGNDAQTPFEQKIVDMLRDLDLGVPEMGIDTPLLDTGMTSVGLIRLKRSLEQAFNIADIPIITIMTNMTVRSLASACDHLLTPKRNTKYDPIVVLQPNGHRIPLWLMHPGIGEMLVFLGLVQYFPDRPIYAMRARGLNPGETPYSGLDEIITSYFQAIKSKQPRGPYALAGYSYGSMLAFEITKRLEAEGEVVQFLGSFNLPPHIKTRMRKLDWTAGMVHIAHFCNIITEERSDELAPQLRPLPHEEQVSKLLAESDQKRCAELALTHAGLLNWTDVSFSLQRIGWDYDPSGTVAHIDIFFCQPLRDVASSRKEYRKDHLNYWVNFIREDLKFWEVDGKHYTMIGAEHVPKFQKTLRQALEARGL